MKIGIYAGTFDPIHRGHIALAEAAIKEAELDRIIIVAEKEPYRKKPIVSWDHRQAMIARATEDLPSIDHNYAFAAELAKQHTMKNMLEIAEKHYGQDNEIWFVVGSDIFEHMHKWQDIVSDEDYGGFVAALRRDHTRAWLDSQLNRLQGHGLQPSIKVVTNQYPELSSGQIRGQANANAFDLKNLPQSVAEYIFHHKLYG